MKLEDSKFLNHSKKLLDDSVESLDAATLSRLNQARQKALQSMSSHNNTGHDFNWQQLLNSRRLFAAYSVIAVFSVTAWLVTSTQQLDEKIYQPLAYTDNDMELLVSDTELELLDELVFVSWLLEIEKSEKSNDARKALIKS